MTFGNWQDTRASVVCYGSPLRPQVHIKIIPPPLQKKKKVSKCRNPVHPGRGDQRRSVKITAKTSAGGDSLTGNGPNAHASDACLTAAQQLHASRVKKSDRRSTLPLDANVGHTCFLCSHSHIKNHLLTSYSPQIGSDLRVHCEMCFMCYAAMWVFTYQQVTVMKNRHNPQFLIIFFPVVQSCFFYSFAFRY